MIWQWLKNLFSKKQTDKSLLSRSTVPKYFEIAINELGEQEILGTKHNPRILEYHATTGKFDDDETPWCASFVNWCLKQAGIKGTGSAMARSFLKFGVATSRPVAGDIVVFWRVSPTSSSGHVGFFVKDNGEFINVLGGNQSNKVCYSNYKKSQVLGYRKVK